MQLELDGLHEENLAPYGISARELAVMLLLDAREPESQQQAAKLDSASTGRRWSR